MLVQQYSAMRPPRTPVGRMAGRQAEGGGATRPRELKEERKKERPQLDLKKEEDALQACLPARTHLHDLLKIMTGSMKSRSSP